MCGFLGEFLFSNEVSIATSIDIFEGLLSLSKHRGPDSSCMYTGENFQLGFNRLAILDISENGNQPKSSPSNRYKVVFNGEIYNYKELEREYQLSDLQSSSDTEVLVHLLDEIGVEKTITSLNGMFSIAIIDTDSKRVYLTRDFAGIKPHFYGISDQGIAFASQFNQIFKHPFFKDSLSLRKEILKEYFGLGYMQAPNTIYENIYQLYPGELITISFEGEIEKRKLKGFSSTITESIEKSAVDITQEFDERINRAIRKQLVSDVPLATFLSGGIDSPLITAIAKTQLLSIEAFTMSVDAKKYDESAKATAYAKHMNINHTVENISETNLLENIDTHFKFMSEPFGDYSSIPTYVISKRARKKHSVMLSGDGGDELFFGYPRMLDVLQKQHWFRLAHTVRKPIFRMAIKFNRYHSWAPYTYKKLEDFILAKHLHISSTKLDRIIRETTFSKELMNLYRLPKQINKRSLLHWLRWNEFYGHLQRVLIKVDRMSMANSLEVRVPFLDKRTIDFAWNKLPQMKGSSFELKKILKEQLGKYYPEGLISKDKKGFSVPIEDWLQNELKPDLIKVIFDTEFYGKEMIDVIAVKEYVAGYLDGKHEEVWGVWHIYAWQKWALSENLI